MAVMAESGNVYGMAGLVCRNIISSVVMPIHGNVMKHARLAIDRLRLGNIWHGLVAWAG
jgi:hypothetical protein